MRTQTAYLNHRSLARVVILLAQKGALLLSVCKFGLCGIIGQPERPSITELIAASERGANPED